MTFRDVLGAVRQWLETVKIEYNSWMEVEILEDSDTLFQVIIESENHMAELNCLEEKKKLYWRVQPCELFMCICKYSKEGNCSEQYFALVWRRRDGS